MHHVLLGSTPRPISYKKLDLMRGLNLQQVLIKPAFLVPIPLDSPTNQAATLRSSTESSAATISRLWQGDQFGTSSSQRHGKTFGMLTAGGSTALFG